MHRAFRIGTDLCLCAELWGPKPVIPTNVLAAFAISFCQRNCVFLCKGTKLQKAALFAIVCRFFCGTELRFGSLCNLGLSKKLRFSLQRHKTADSGLYRIPGQAAAFMHRALFWHRASFMHRNSGICSRAGAIP